MSTINLTAHGFVGGERIVLTDLVGGAPLDSDFVYFVLAAGITADTFQISETDGGTPLTFATLTSANMQVVSDVYEGSNITASAATDLITSPAHGFVVDDAVQFTVLVGGAGLDINTLYYVIASGFTVDTFKVSLTLGGAAVDITTDATAGFVTRVAGYAPITDPEDVQAPPAERHVTHSWPDAPGQPQNFLVASGYKAIGGRWDATSVGDLMFYEFRYAPDDGTGTGPNTTLWTKHQVKTSVIYIDNLTIDQLYWCQVRSVDFAGQTVTSDVDPTPVDYLANADAGYTASISVVPGHVPEGDVAFNSVLANIVSTNSLDASTITSGLLSISTSVAGTVDGLRIYLSGTLVGFWDDTGLYIADVTRGIPVNPDGSIGDLTTVPWLHLNNAAISVYDGATIRDLADQTGANATGITRGIMPGGPNLLKNGSFEMADWSSTAASTKVWDVTADFTGTEVSSTNVTNSNAITATAGTGTY